MVVREESGLGGGEGLRAGSAAGLVKGPPGCLMACEWTGQPAVMPGPETTSEVCFASAFSHDLAGLACAHDV